MRPKAPFSDRCAIDVPEVMPRATGRGPFTRNRERDRQNREANFGNSPDLQAFSCAFPRVQDFDLLP
jgi:hypothetical protein